MIPNEKQTTAFLQNVDYISHLPHIAKGLNENDDQI